MVMFLKKNYQNWLNRTCPPGGDIQVAYPSVNIIIIILFCFFFQMLSMELSLMSILTTWL